MFTKDKMNRKGNSISYINMPITSKQEDKIGIAQYAQDIKHVIGKGAQSIAITSDFGGGKSSLVRYLETCYLWPFTKFCYVNLWSHETTPATDSEGTKKNAIELHKSFIYQLASQISRRKGNFVSRRLNPNYGMIGITLPSVWTAIVSVLAFACMMVGLVCTTLFDTISPYLDFMKDLEHREEIGMAAYVITAFLAVILLYNTDIIFSSKNSEAKRVIDEHELMDIYRTYICGFHLRHYIVVIEDLDRSDKDMVIPFIKELKRYYVPCLGKRSRFGWVNMLCDSIERRVNRITFIVNIKSEYELTKDTSLQNLYSKAFDYVVNLKEVNVDNYEVILKKLLDDQQKLCEANNIIVFGEDGNPLPAFEWMIHGEGIGVREIKTRLNDAFSTYIAISAKFSDKEISLEKCVAASYIQNAFEMEYAAIKQVGFDDIIDLYVTNPTMTSEEIIDKYTERTEGKCVISEKFANDIWTLVRNGMISSDYRQYFYNYPSDSYLYSDKETELSNVILYDKKLDNPEEFDKLVASVVNSNVKIIKLAFERLVKLEKLYPDCVFQNADMYRLAYNFNREWIFKSLAEKYPYDVESVSATGKLLLFVISQKSCLTQTDIVEICKIISTKAEPRAIVSLRKLIFQNEKEDILQFKSLYFEECPLITKAEVDSMKAQTGLLELVNFDSAEMDMELVEVLHQAIVPGLLTVYAEKIGQVALFYEKIFYLFMPGEKERLVHYLFEVLETIQIMNETLERLIMENNPEDDTFDRYIDLVIEIDANGQLPTSSLYYLDKEKTISGLSETVCCKLEEAGYYETFIVNAYHTNIELIDFEKPEIIQAVNALDFSEGNGLRLTDRILVDMRLRILKCKKDIRENGYRRMFQAPYPIITEEELFSIKKSGEALLYIDGSLIDEDSLEYVAEYFSEGKHELKESYEILRFVGEIPNEIQKRQLFEQLNFDNIPYYRMSAQRKEEILGLMSDVYDFDDVMEQLAYMTLTKCSNDKFEAAIKKEYQSEKAQKIEKAYVEYMKALKKVTVSNVMFYGTFGHYYAMPPHILEKLYAAKLFRFYVASKVSAEGEFIFEEDKLETLYPAYEYIFLSGKEWYSTIKEKMVKTQSFVSYMCDKKLFKGTSEYTRMHFSHCTQTAECLKDLFDNYSSAFIVEYLSKSGGFRNREAAEFFLEKIKENPKVAASEDVYANNHHRFLDSGLKGVFTKYHNNAK